MMTFAIIRALMPPELSRGEINSEIVRRIIERLNSLNRKPPFLYRGIGRDKVWWYMIMKGKRNISIVDLLEIARLLDVQPGELLPGYKPSATEPVSIDEQIEKRVLEILERRKRE